MIKDTLQKNAIQKLESAKILLNANCYNDAIYLAGYSLELALKWKFCDKLGIDFPEKIEGINIKTHNLESLVYICGEKSNLEHDIDWGVIKSREWSEQIRYSSKNFTLLDVKDMIDSCYELLKKLNIITL